MEIEISSADKDVSRLRVRIDFEPHAKGFGRRTPGLAATYARRRVQQLVGDGAGHFGLVPGAWPTLTTERAVVAPQSPTKAA